MGSNPYDSIIVVTGGPGGGKTTFLREILEKTRVGAVSFIMRKRTMEPPQCSMPFLLVPESATRLIEQGYLPGTEDFQRRVFRLQIETEESFIEHRAAPICGDRQSRLAASHAPQQPLPFLFCDRGTLDGLAYWLMLDLSMDSFYAMTGMSHQEHLQRYLGVIHLETAASGASEYYQQIELNRPESIEEARRIDRLLAQVWESHPGYHFIPNGTGGWKQKFELASLVLKWWGISLPPEEG